MVSEQESKSKDLTVTVDDQTENNQFAEPDTVSFIGGPDIQESEFNTYNRTSVSLQPDTLYDILLRSESDAVYESRFRFRDGQRVDTLKLTPGRGSGEVTNGTKVHLDGVNNTDNPLPDSTSVTVDPGDEITNIEYSIEDGNGNPVYNGSREFDDPTSYYQTEIGENQTNGTTADEDWSVDYSGTYENGTSFSGESDYSGEISGAFGPTGGSGGGGGSPIVGVALVGGAGYLAYRRFGSGQLGSAVSSAARRLGP
ncbi:hypothetical protein [Haloarcula laminariae]|uniref:hypothetical protein n=1 Tax=Haloarcula laminariae TaxID=2961577 RepID=UPI00240644CE|nr:hypothetical protein [Halomicroarcula sp. FL173]